MLTLRDFMNSLDHAVAGDYVGGYGRYAYRGLGHGRRYPARGWLHPVSLKPRTTKGGSKAEKTAVEKDGAIEKDRISKVADDILNGFLEDERKIENLERTGTVLFQKAVAEEALPAFAREDMSKWNPSAPRGGATGVAPLHSTRLQERLAKKKAQRGGGGGEGGLSVDVNLEGLGPDSDPKQLYESAKRLAETAEQLEMDRAAAEAEIEQLQQGQAALEQYVDQLGATEPLLADIPPFRSALLRSHVERLKADLREQVLALSMEDQANPGVIPGQRYGGGYGGYPSPAVFPRGMRPPIVPGRAGYGGLGYPAAPYMY